MRSASFIICKLRDAGFFPAKEARAAEGEGEIEKRVRYLVTTAVRKSGETVAAILMGSNMDEDVTGAPASGRQNELLVALNPDVYVKQVKEPPQGFWDECLTAQAKPTT
ncbi:hypothetical protein LTR17_014127 [Elasticomyces elasticus]|nr:hypothetical protein LTR17_014127 [Elasticomyces elasticus]